MRGIVMLALPLAACASSGSGPERPETDIVEVVGAPMTTPGSRLELTSNNAPTTVTVALVADDVWRVLPAVYDSLGIPINLLDQAKRTVGNSGFKVRRRLGTAPLSRFLECGTTQIGPNADSYDVYLAVYTTVRPGKEGGTSVIATGLDASAKPVAFTGDYSTCSSKGLLESRIIDAIKAKLRAR